MFLRYYITGIFPRYLFSLFIKSFIAMISIFGGLIFLLTLIEILRRTNGQADILLLDKIIVTLKQIPFILEQILPLLILMTCLWVVITLSRHSEIIVAKASAVSLWRMGGILSIISITIACFFIYILNPYSVKWMKDYHDWNQNRRENITVFEEKLSLGNDNIIVMSDAYDAKRQTFKNISLYYSNQDHLLLKIISAPFGYYDLKTDYLILKSPDILKIKNKKLKQNTETIPRYTLSFKELKPFLRLQSKADQIYSIYSYPDIIKRDQYNKLDTTPLKSKFYALIVSPILCGLMGLLCVITASRSIRKGQIYQNALIGLLFGFVLYSMDMIFITLGGGGTLPLIMSVLLAKLIGLFIIIWIVLQREYGYIK